MQVQLHKYYCGNWRQQNNDKTKQTAANTITKSKMTAQQKSQNRRANNSGNKRITNTQTHTIIFSSVFFSLLQFTFSFYIFIVLLSVFLLCLATFIYFCFFLSCCNIVSSHGFVYLFKFLLCLRELRATIRREENLLQHDECNNSISGCQCNTM